MFFVDEKNPVSFRVLPWLANGRSLGIIVRLSLSLLFTFCVFASPILAQDEKKPVSISLGNWLAATTADNGVRVAYRGVTVVNGTRFLLRDLAGRHVLFSSADAQPTIQAESNVLRLSFEGRGTLADGSGWACEASLRVTLLDERRVLVAGDLTHTGPALRLGTGGLWLAANPLKGCVWRGRGPRGIVHGALPLQPNLLRSNEEDFRFALWRGFVRSRIGDLMLTVGGNCGALNFSDARRANVEDPQHAAVFWLGINNARLQPNQSKRWEVTLEMTDNPARLVRPTLKVNGSMGQWVNGFMGNGQWSMVNGQLPVVEVNDAQTPVETPVVVVPRPQVYEPRASDFALREDTRILFAESDHNAGQRVARYLSKELRRLFKLNLPVSQLASDTLPENVIFIGRHGMGACGEEEGSGKKGKEGDTVEHQTPPPSPSFPLLPAEGYLLSADDKRVVVTGADARGTFYGVQTLLQMVKTLPNGQRAIQGAQVRDHPDFPFRGVHLHADKDTLPWVTQLIENVFSRLKINHIVLECQYARWDSHPELAPPWAMSKDDMRKLRQVAEEHFIQVIPLIQSLGHCEWMFARGQNLDLTEDKNAPYACCPSEPKVYNLLGDIYKEAIEVFQPEYLHVGLDEILNRGRFGECPRCLGTPIPDLFLNHVLRLYNFLKDRNVKMMMWGDMLLAPGEARDAVHGGPPAHMASVRITLPKDTVICDWHYAPANDYPSVRVFRQLGFPVIGCTWHNPYNIYSFAQSAHRAGAMGMLQTTWAGYHGNRTVLRREPQQVAAYVLAAERVWNAQGGYTLPYLPRYWLRDALAAKSDATASTATTNGVRKGFCLDLSSLTNIDLMDNDQMGGWLRMGAGNDLRRAPKGQQRLGGTLFRVSESESHLGGRGIMLGGNYSVTDTFPTSLEIPVRRRVRALHFLHTCAWQVSPGTKVGTYDIIFTDGTREEVELTYGDNIAAWDEPAALYAPYAVWHGYTLQGVPVSLQAATWESSNGSKEIDRIVFRSAHPEASPVLLAVTGVEES